MNELKQTMIRSARRQYRRIYPCSTKKSFGDCFTVEEDQILFWFNTADNTTHVLMHNIA